ncbi:M20 family metallopeptidase [Bacillus sp. B1-b2]|uniref:M20 family metallopeptidase n=1 Tax=Bacillus sp. B1-b2 TaxID=2653201 RepID=UPI001261ED84|nr:M20 family metallopeptidase [Bacillus sp. B1-b2]KAB7667753.1 M20 family metallopeptidase [Bacillus sp. B1-b2]
MNSEMLEKTQEDILAKINESEIITLLQDLVRIPSISGNEAEIAHYLNKVCLGLGLESTIDAHGNVIARLKGSKPGPRIALNSHMDTVGYGEGWTFDPIGGEVVGNRIYGRGSCDCKSSIASQIMAVKALIESKADLAGEIALTYVVKEEVQDAMQKGTVKLLNDGFQADMAINGEAIDMNIGLAGGGMAEVEVKTIGKRAHGSTPFEGVNAIHSMMKVAHEISLMKPGYHPLTGDGSIVLGVIEGGERSSVVPDECTLKVSRFLVPGENGEDFYQEILEILDKLSVQDAQFKATAELTYSSKPSLVESNEKIVESMVHAFHLLELPPTFSGTPQHCDVDYLVNQGKIPTVIFGPGKIKVGHIPDEYVEITEVVTAANIYALTLYELLKA